jgi:hypothetical protein
MPTTGGSVVISIGASAVPFWEDFEDIEAGKRDKMTARNRNLEVKLKTNVANAENLSSRVCNHGKCRQSTLPFCRNLDNGSNIEGLRRVYRTIVLYIVT